MEDDELDFEHISIKSEYEHRKNVITIFMLSIVIAVLMDAWKYFFLFIERTMQYAVSGQGNEAETAKVVFVFSVLAVAFITVIVFSILITHTKRMHGLNKTLMIIEEIQKKRSN